jgi:hypothetical protein
VKALAEYIEREKVQDIIVDIYKDGNDAAEETCIKIWERIREMHALNLPLKRGKWIPGDYRDVTAVCSNCGRLRLGNGAESAKKYAPFCEKCGAYMGEQT